MILATKSRLGLKFASQAILIKNPINTVISKNFSLLNQKLNVSPKFQLKSLALLPPLAAGGYLAYRYLSIQEITKSLHLYTEEPRIFTKDPKTLRLKQESGDKPMVLILSWLLANQKHIKKFAQVYTEQGCDVLVAHITPWQLLWPSSGTQLVALDIVKFLEANDYYKQLFIHGFSVGGYFWGECLVQMQKDITKYQKVIDRICGQIWDSAADITEIPVGVPRALFPRNPVLQSGLENYMQYHLKTFHEAATQHYIRSSQMYHMNLVHSPALFILSKTDPVGAEASNRRVADSWISLGVDVTWRCFDRSPHVGHYMKHRESYMQYWFDHLAKVKLIKNPELMRAKL
ncbi:unnamed protein product [Diamesa serratosioi]